MSAAKNTTPVSVTCPKCGGGQKIAQFKHVENGVCFLCNGAGVTDAATAAGFERAALAAVVRDDRRSAPAPAPAQNVKSKPVQLGLDFLADGARVERHEDGRFALVCNKAEGRVHGDDFRVYFTITSGQIEILSIQDGLKPYRKQIAAALQGALKR